MKNIIFALLILSLLLLSSCGGNAVLPETTTPPTSDISADTSDETPETEPSVNVNWSDSYAALLDGVADDTPETTDTSTYSLYDADGDTVPELFIKAGTCEADFEYRVYTMSASDSELCLLGTLSAGHSSLCGIDTENAFLVRYGQMGYEQITEVTISDGQLMGEVLFEAEVQEYHDFTLVSEYALTDRDGLSWQSNAPENNRSVLDSFS